MELGSRLVARFWYYFRIGYATYLTFILGYVSTLITVYYLAIKNLPYLLNLFPKFEGFSVLATAIGAPASVIIGWLHLKRTRAYTSEADITIESNPYTYKAAPGKELEAFVPSYLELVRLVSKLADSQKLMTKEDQLRIKALETKLEKLCEGKIVGNPRRHVSSIS
jgi:uncharacterized membrane protein